MRTAETVLPFEIVKKRLWWDAAELGHEGGTWGNACPLDGLLSARSTDGRILNLENSEQLD